MAVSIKRTIGYIPASAQRSFSRISFVYFLSNVVLTSELIIISCWYCQTVLIAEWFLLIIHSWVAWVYYCSPQRLEAIARNKGSRLRYATSRALKRAVVVGWRRSSARASALWWFSLLFLRVVYYPYFLSDFFFRGLAVCTRLKSLQTIHYGLGFNVERYAEIAVQGV